ncbi:MAG: hypothetical protein JWN44_6680 [Myxococcales bacterium]|nr:hypothetical protein [Myxococcales bacterium]
MSGMSHERYIKLIDEMIVGDVAPGDWQELRAHLGGCTSCRARYDRVALAERMLHGGPAALAKPSPSSFDRIGAAILDGAAAPTPAWQRALHWLAPKQRWAVGVAAVAAAAVLIPFLARSPSRPGGEFQVRGAGSGERTAGLRAFCIGDNGVTPKCARATQLRLTLSNSGKFQRVFVVGFDDDWSPKWYAPRPPELQSVAAPDGVDVPVGPAVKLGVNHEPGKVRIYALFSDAPVSAPEIEAAAERMRQQDKHPSGIEVLPLLRTDVLQKSVLVDVEP